MIKMSPASPMCERILRGIIEQMAIPQDKLLKWVMLMVKIGNPCYFDTKVLQIWILSTATTI